MLLDHEAVNRTLIHVASRDVDHYITLYIKEECDNIGNECIL